MALQTSIRSAVRRSLCSPSRHTLQPIRLYATDTPAPPLLQKIRNDLKTAMRAKDKERLEVLRAVLADVTNKEKESQKGGLKTDVQLLALLQKRIANSKKAAHGFGEAGRIDLKDREDSQIEILDEYAGAVEVLSEEEMRATVGAVVQKLSESTAAGRKVSKGEVTKALLAPGGAFDGKPVNKAEVMQLVNLALGE